MGIWMCRCVGFVLIFNYLSSKNCASAHFRPPICAKLPFQRIVKAALVVYTRGRYHGFLYSLFLFSLDIGRSLNYL
jgi:hypothetical protein